MMERILVKELVNANFTNQSSKESFQFCCVDEDDRVFVPDESHELFFDMDIGSIGFDFSAWQEQNSSTSSEDGYGELMDMSSPVAWRNSKFVEKLGFSRTDRESAGMEMGIGSEYAQDMEISNCHPCSYSTGNSDSGKIDNINDACKTNKYDEEFNRHCGYYDDEYDEDHGDGDGDCDGNGVYGHNADMCGNIPFAWERRHRGSYGGKEDLPDACAPEIQEFEFSITFSKDEALGVMSPADDLFYKGQLLPLHLPPRLQMVEDLSTSTSSDAQLKDSGNCKGDSDAANGTNMPKHVVELEVDEIGPPLISRNPSFRVDIQCVDDGVSSQSGPRQGCLDVEVQCGDTSLARQGGFRESSFHFHIERDHIGCPLPARQPSFHIQPSELQHQQKQKQEQQLNVEHDQLRNGKERCRWIDGLLSDCKDADVFPNCYKDPATLHLSRETQANNHRIQSSSSTLSSLSKKQQDAASSVIWKVLLPDSRTTYNSSVLDIVPSPRYNDSQEKSRWSCSFKLRVSSPLIRSLFAQKHNGNVLIHQCNTTSSTFGASDHNGSENRGITDASRKLEYTEPSFRLTEVITESQSTGCREQYKFSKRKGKYYLDKYMKLFKSFYQVVFSTKKQHPRHDHHNPRHLLDQCSADDCTPKVSSSSSSSLCPFSPTLSTSSSSSSSSSSVCKVSQSEHKLSVYNEAISSMKSRSFNEKDAEINSDIAIKPKSASKESNSEATSSLKQDTISETEHLDIENNVANKLNDKFTVDEYDSGIVNQSMAVVDQDNSKETMANRKPSEAEYFNEMSAKDIDQSKNKSSTNSSAPVNENNYSSNTSLVYFDAEDSIQGAIAHCKRCSAEG